MSKPSDRIRVLLVEDEPQVLRALSAWLKVHGFDVTAVPSVKGAKEALEATFDVILLDFFLGDGTGHDVIHHAAGLKKVPRIIVLSGAITVEAAHRVGQQGAVAVMSKPADLGKLAQAIEQAAQTHVPCGDDLIGQLGTAVYRDAVESVKVALVTSALRRCNGSRSGAARLLGMTRQQLQKLIRRYELGDAESQNNLNAQSAGASLE